MSSTSAFSRHKIAQTPFIVLENVDIRCAVKISKLIQAFKLSIQVWHTANLGQLLPAVMKKYSPFYIFHEWDTFIFNWFISDNDLYEYLNKSLFKYFVIKIC